MKLFDDTWFNRASICRLIKHFLARFHVAMGAVMPVWLFHISGSNSPKTSSSCTISFSIDVEREARRPRLRNEGSSQCRTCSHLLGSLWNRCLFFDLSTAVDTIVDQKELGVSRPRLYHEQPRPYFAQCRQQF
jgi:hypothetical protein